MDRETRQRFIRTAEADLASVRGSLLIIAQTGETGDTASARRDLARIITGASENAFADVAEMAAACDDAIGRLGSVAAPAEVYSALDIIARIEASILEIPLASDEFPADISEFVDASFDDLVPEPEISGPPEDADFEIDEETLDIFRCEADDLLSSINKGLERLRSKPGDQNVLWEIRRSSHTFKGAAGIVGLKAASNIAHRMEDLLDQMVENRCEADPKVISFLTSSADAMAEMVANRSWSDDLRLQALYEDAVACISAEVPSGPSAEADAKQVLPVDASPSDIVRQTTTPIVRVSLDRLDELIKLSRSLLVNRSALAERFDELCISGAVDAPYLIKLESLIETQRHLSNEIEAKLLKIRMVRFGTLETRLNRTVNVTCTDEGKKAFIEIENGDIEIDTQLIDALIEPLLHLIKNAVVHGIETPELRRLVGKPERGRVCIRIENDDEELRLFVIDDGAGISAAKLIERAVSSGHIGRDRAETITEAEALQLVFSKGLTTAEKLDLNAGRGIGMNIVKECIEARGGRILIESQPHTGSTFTLVLPHHRPNAEPVPAAGEIEEVSTTSAILPPLILIVDDSPTVRRQAAQMLEAAGLRVITANNGAEALELLLNGEWEPDLIMSDVEMPHIDGWEFLEYVKTDDNFGHVPVVMVTSLDSTEYRDRADALGASGYIVKPFGLSDLETIVGLVAAAEAI